MAPASSEPLEAASQNTTLIAVQNVRLVRRRSDDTHGSGRSHCRRRPALRSAASYAGPRRGPEVDFFIGIGPTYGYVPPPYYVYPPPYYAYPPPPVVYSAPVVLPSPVYVTAPPPAVPAYWYFCPSYGAYYPTVSACPQPWVPVPAR